MNLHSQCHELVHFDIPWSLIRIEQRNGRIDRYGQTQRPQITTLVLQPDSERFSGDIRVLKKLIEKENEAHTALGDAAALMGKYTAEAEEEAIKAALAKGQDLDEVVTDVEAATQHDEILDLIMNGLADDTDDAGDDASKLENPGTNAYPGDTTYPGPDTYPTDPATGLTLYPTPVAFLQDGLAMVYRNHPEQRPGTGGSGGVSWQFHSREAIGELEPPRDMWSRLESLPQSYLKERKVKENFKLASNKAVGRTLVDAARNSTDAKNASLWPEAHYLGPLHPVLDWVADRALSRIPERGGIYIVRAEVEAPTVVVHAGLTNRRGQMVSSVFRTVTFPGGTAEFGLTGEFENAAALIADLGLRSTNSNPGPIDTSIYQPLVPAAIDIVGESIEEVIDSGRRRIEQRVHEWFERNEKWKQGALDLVQATRVKQRLRAVNEEDDLIRSMQPNRSLLRPLLVAVPISTPVSVTVDDTTEEN